LVFLLNAENAVIDNDRVKGGPAGAGSGSSMKVRREQDQVDFPRTRNGSELHGPMNGFPQLASPLVCNP
jgi:hypothetical protein